MPENNLKIAFYRYSLLNRGGDRIVLEYANHLAGLGYAVIIYLSIRNTVFYVNPNIKIVTVPWPGKPGFILFGLLRKIIADVVLVDIIHLTLIVGIRNRVIYFSQADDVEYYESRFARNAVDLLYKSYFSLNKYAITVDERLTFEFSNRYGFNNLYTVTNGIDLKMFYPDSDCGLINVKGSKIAVVLMARGDYYRKGFDIAMEVLGKIASDVESMMELWVCGNHLNEANFPFTIRNFGTVSDDRLRQILSSADVFFYPSRHEGFGLFPLEAMACGTVVITTDAVPYAKSFDCIVATAREDTATLSKCLVNLIYDKILLCSLKAKVCQVARKFDINLSKDKFVIALNEIVARQNECV